MSNDKYAFWITLVAGPILGGFFAYFVSASVLNEFAWCISGEEHCVREWISATSGWAAALAAAVAIGPLLGQLREQRRQTSFVLGDAEPTVDIERRAYLSLRIRLVNWNRRALYLRPLQFKMAGKSYNPRSILRSNENQSYTSVGDYGFTIAGWEDRSSAPPFSELAIELEEDGKIGDFNQPILVEVVGQLIGEGGGSFYRRISIDRWGGLLSS
ncbi:hypothetical protein LB516_15930 [Mesorhizobium sp. CO1-1-7]|uniref:hypothetical protein n=1 Tax=Mesorhizobium sp. CO1-1-7 TaxID=2876632 RepID=UPI001CD16C6E|nr:hypothetical protein [Mesorhizobium sp. CO1-1-7]MBZ9746743.1 hypothetical protein [Mesorhizobium sp. CO1-1-7]